MALLGVMTPFDVVAASCLPGATGLLQRLQSDRRLVRDLQIWQLAFPYLDFQFRVPYSSHKVITRDAPAQLRIVLWIGQCHQKNDSA